MVRVVGLLMLSPSRVLTAYTVFLALCQTKLSCVLFYGISIIVGYLMLNCLYITEKQGRAHK